ncbi:hypothetical protein [Natronorubrum sp. DTA7]|uniref:hypothetical protein n=1 Tax=Natronorubrum sp. DTA7 TaxID=3447016 RepID=UPI003F862430
MDKWKPDDLMRAFVKQLEAGETIVVDARDKTRSLEVAEPARHVRDAYRTNGYYLPLEGHGTHYTLCVPDSEVEAIRLRYPSKPGLGVPVSRLDRQGTAAASRDTPKRPNATGATDQDQPPITSDTTAADIMDPGPEGDFR